MTAEELIKESEKELEEAFRFADEISEYNQEKVLKAFQRYRVALQASILPRATGTETKGGLCWETCLLVLWAPRRGSFPLRCFRERTL